MAEASSSTADAVNHLVDKIGDGLGQITAAISSHAPQAWSLAVAGGHAQAAATMVIGGIFFFVFALLATVSVLLIRWACLADESKSNRDVEPYGICGILIGCASVVFLIATLVNVCDTHAWAMMLSPEGTTARDLLLRAL